MIEKENTDNAGELVRSTNFQWQVMHDLLQLRLNLVWIVSVWATQTRGKAVHSHIGETLKSLHRITRPYA